MPPQQQSPTPSPTRQIVTLTVYSSPTASQTGLPPSPYGGGGTSVPIAAIVGGAVGGAVLAIFLVIIWKHWGRMIKRTDRQRRKEMQDILTMRENTRRNATSGFRPQSQYRPMFTLNRESRRVTFLTRSSTSQQRPSNDNNNATPSAPVQTEGEKGQNESAVAPNSSGDIGSMDAIRQLSPNFGSSATPLLVGEATSPLPAGAAGSERKSESGERPVLEKEPEAGKSTELISPPPPPPRHTTPSPPPVPSSPTRTTPKRAPSPTPSGSTSKQTAAPRPSRSVRMRTPKRLPDPPSAPPSYVGRDHARPSSPEPRSSVSLPRTSSIGSSRTFDSGVRSTSPTPLLPPVPPVPPVPVIPPAEPSASSSASSPPSQPSWSRSPLRNSVLPSDHPVILPRPKNPRTSESFQPVSPTSTLGHLPSLSGSMSQSGESSKPLHNRFLGSLRRGKGKSLVETARPISTLSEASAYSTND
ncbi:hypothetical protein F5888DRAFT_326606 [Russula emetica]|nr:hypothetical protein F5888DRAFT_326606 [Russula emetica]